MSLSIFYFGREIKSSFNSFVKELVTMLNLRVVLLLSWNLLMNVKLISKLKILIKGKHDMLSVEYISQRKGY